MKLSRRDLETLDLVSLHRARNWSKAEVSSGERDGVAFVVKDFRAAPRWFKPFARAFLRREWRALNALKDVEGVPRALCRPDADSIVIERVDGTPMFGRDSGEVSDAALRKLCALVEEIHRRGVTHGDLHQQNVLLCADGEIALIDWATAHVWRNSRSLRQKMRDEFAALDRRGLAKIKVIHAPHLVSSEDIDLIQNGASPIYRAVKKLRRAGEKLRGKKRGDAFAEKLRIAEELLAKGSTVEIDRTA